MAAQLNLDYLHDVLAKRGGDVHGELQRLTGRTILASYVEERAEKIRRYRDQLQKLKAIPVVEQRTQQWYDMRQSMMTASDLAQAIGKGKFQSQKDFYVKKAGYEEQTFDFTIPPLKWGCMFEQVANTFYEHLTGTKVHEFGLLKHPELDWFGASPDGVTDEGIMLEIKAPFRRKIDGTVPEQYYLQMLGQMDVAGLDECDYLECMFQTYPHEQAFIADQGAQPGTNVNGEHIGIVLESRDGGGPFVYEYSPWGLAANDAVIWANNVRAAKPQFDKAHFWYLEKYNVIRIYKDADLIAKHLEAAAEVWNRVLHFRQNRGDYDMFVKGLGGPTGVARVSKAPVIKKPSAAPKPKALDLSAYAFLDD